MITDVPGIRVGHWTDREALTGCTVILPPEGATGSVAVPGLAPATRETDVLGPRTRQLPNAILLTGGSAFGLAAADGVMAWLAERGIGHWTPVTPIPIVPAAAIFDLGLGSSAVRPGPDQGRAACDAASADGTREGNVGAGTGATVGKTAGLEHRSKGGLGSASVRDGDLVVGALVVVNPVGDVTEDDGTVIAGARAAEPWDPPSAGTNTTLCCVATNAVLDKPGCYGAARLAAGALGRAIRPVHTMFDGDVIFALATNDVKASVAAVADGAAEALVESIRRAVRAATGVEGAPAMGHR